MARQTQLRHLSAGRRPRADGCGRPGAHAWRDVITAPTLVPKLAEPIAGASAVIFVDARAGADSGAIHCEEIGGRAEPHPLGHAAGPEGLLQLVDELYGRRPNAWVVSVTGADFGFGLDLSAHLFRTVPETIRVVEGLIERLRRLSTA